MLDAFRRREKRPAEIAAERRQEAREDVAGGTAEIGGRKFRLKNWSANGFCIVAAGLRPTPGDRLDASFTIPLPEGVLSFRCRVGVMRFDPERHEIGGVFFNLPDEVQAAIDAHFRLTAPKGYGATLFEKLGAKLGVG